jgi:hypothetical protein
MIVVYEVKKRLNSIKAKLPDVIPYVVGPLRVCSGTATKSIILVQGRLRGDNGRSVLEAD